MEPEAANDTSVQDLSAQTAGTGENDNHAYNEDEDDIDFNLGNEVAGGEVPASNERHGPGIKEDG